MTEPALTTRIVRHSLKRLTVVVLAACLALIVPGIAAQDGTLPVQQTAEYDIGFKCPVASTLDPAETVLWLLMNTCSGANYSLHGFRLEDASPIDTETDFFASALEPLYDQWIYADTHPMAFTPDGTLDILYSETEEYDTRNLRLSLDVQPAPDDPRAVLLTLDTLNEIIPGYAGYPETTTYNADHTLAAALDSASLHIIDLQAGESILQFEVDADTYNAFPSFSADSQRFYIATFNNIDDVDDYSAILHVYSLPDGDLLETYDVPSGLLWVSPNGQYAAARLGDSQGETETLYVVELASGKTSPPINVFEEPQRVLKCRNRESDLSDLNYMTSGKLPIIDLIWLPDSSGFFTVNSYLGEGSQSGGGKCFWNYSRLRHYSVGAE